MSTLTRIEKVVALALLATIPVGLVLIQMGFLPKGFSWNGTESLPIGLYWHTNARLPPKVGDIVCTNYRAPEWAHDRDYLPEGFLVCKKVLGLPGDQIRRSNNRIEVCRNAQCLPAGEVVLADRHGRPVQAAQLPAVIPNGTVYLSSLCEPLSLDSRYLGLVSMRDLVRTLHPITVKPHSGCEAAKREG